ncbi:MAG: hypothetical protein Q7U44_05905, partial [Desulfuromonadales bacterium]|nr:hypothetical protein [Desulfuromonadales bacterium]
MLFRRLHKRLSSCLALLFITGGLTACTGVEMQRALANLPTTMNQPTALSITDIAEGLKEALRIGSER